MHLDRIVDAADDLRRNAKDLDLLAEVLTALEWHRSNRPDSGVLVVRVFREGDMSFKAEFYDLQDQTRYEHAPTMWSFDVQEIPNYEEVS
jgi:hypothetical protein